MTQITLRLHEQEASGRRASEGTVERVRRVLTELGGELRPQHPAVDDAELSAWYVGEVPADAVDDEVLERLRAIGGVDAAYVKPAEEAP